MVPVKYLPFTVDESRRVAPLKRDKREKGIFFPGELTLLVGDGATFRSPLSLPCAARLLFS